MFVLKFFGMMLLGGIAITIGQVIGQSFLSMFGSLFDKIFGNSDDQRGEK